MSETEVWETPLWLTNDYLENVLKKYLKDEKVQILRVDVKPANAKGENYISAMSRIRITFKSEESLSNQLQELSLILKSSYDSDPFIAKLMSGYGVYQTEMEMYDKILPKMAETLHESGDKELLFAKTFKVDYDKSTIIFEDLKAKNFTMADRLKGLNEEHCYLAMKKIAKFHAAAAVMNERQPGILENYDHGIFNRHSRGFAPIYEYLFEEAAHFAKHCPELGEYYSEKLLKITPHCVEYGTRAYNNNSRHFFSLSHGDVWVNNLMVSYDNCNDLKDMLLIDFQFCNWSSAAVDLHYFFNISLEPELVINPEVQDKLVQYYHSVLAETLRKLKYQGHIPTLHEFCVQMEEGRFLALTAILVNRAFMTVPPSADAEFHSLIGNTEKAHRFRRNCYKNESLQKVMKSLLPYLDRRGLLDLQK